MFDRIHFSATRLVGVETKHVHLRVNGLWNYLLGCVGSEALLRFRGPYRVEGGPANEFHPFRHSLFSSGAVGFVWKRFEWAMDRSIIVD
jgi:hypothetical protein